MTAFPADTPLMRCRAELAKPERTIENLVALDVQVVADHYGIPLDWVKFERERAITERGGKPWELLSTAQRAREWR